MRKNLPFVATLLLISFLSRQAVAQVIDNSTNKDVNTVQQAIMIIPFITKGQEYRKVYDDSKTTQLAIDKLKEGFGNRQYHVVDFVTAYDNAQTDGTLVSLKSQDDIISAVARSSSADILIKVDVIPLRQTDMGRIATVRLIASDAATSYDYATKPCQSPSNSTPDTVGLILRALSEEAHPSPVTDFFNMLQTSFTDMLQRGRSLKVVFNIDKNSMRKFDSEIEGQPLSDVINTWMKAHAYKGYFKLQNVTDIQLTIAEVKIPIKDSNGQNYSPYDFMSMLSAFMKSKKLKVGQPYLNAGAINVNIN